MCETLTTAPWTDRGAAARATGHATAASAMAILAYVLAVLLVVPSVADVSNAQRTESIKVGSEDVDGRNRETFDEPRTQQKQQQKQQQQRSHRPTASMTRAAAAHGGDHAHMHIGWANLAITAAVTTFAAMAVAVVYLALQSEDEASKNSKKRR